MAHMKPKQVPIELGDATKTDLRTQFAALCYRVTKTRLEVLLVTSRRTGRWIIPKGWPEDGKTPTEAALQEAWEEAGVKGKVTGPALGLYTYQKGIGDDTDLPCVAMVYPVLVKSLADAYPEQGQRKRKWMRPKRAAELVDEPELKHILEVFYANRPTP